jgi:hypothetical protein
MNIDPQNVFDKIDVEELPKVTLDLGNIDSPTGSEGPVADYGYDWLRREGFETSKLALYPDWPNVVATFPGTDEGRSLCSRPLSRPSSHGPMRKIAMNAPAA